MLKPLAGFLARAWRGEERLWKVWWYLGGSVGIVFGLPNLAISEKLVTMALLLVLLWSILGLVAYFVLVVMAWRCSPNVDNKIWTPIARVAIVLGLLRMAISFGALFSQQPTLFRGNADRSGREAKAFDASLLPMADWKLVEQKPMSASWRDLAGDAVTLTRGPAGLVTDSLSDERSLQRFCRRIAESQGAGLVDVEAATSAEGPCLRYIYKRLEKPGFKFFGVVAIPVPQATWIWMVVTVERGETGVREAVVAAKLFEAGRLTLESYKTSWAQDPYDPGCAGVDKSTLRYLSDSPEYDDYFPDHPLTKMRRELQRLIEIRISPPASN